MNINWFPGHMTKSMRMMRENVKAVDVFIYLLDARAAFSCINPELNKLAGNKPILYVLSKADLVLPQDINSITNRLNQEGKIVLSFSSFNKKTSNSVTTAVKKLCEYKLNKYASKGAAAVIRAMVVGIPNSGKSTLINCLSCSGAAVTGNKAGVTRGKQWIKIDDYFELLDTPGTLYPKLTNQTVARRLAYLGSINDDILDFVELSLDFIAELDAINPSYIYERYKLNGEFKADEEKTLTQVKLEAIALSRCFVKKGGEPDIEKAARALMDDFRKGRLGKIALER